MNIFKKLFSGQKQTQPKLFVSIEMAKEFVDRLEKAGYYKYADPIDLQPLKEDLWESISKHGVLSTIDVYEEPFTPKEYRFYYLDGEELFEEGGIIEKLEDMRPTFEKINLRLDITNHVEEFDSENESLNHKISLNGKEYIIFRNFDKGYGWGEAAKRFAEIINDQLLLQNKEERLYLINGGNDGRAVYLTNEQFTLMESFLTDKQWKLLDVKEWSKEMDVNYEV